MAQAFYEMSYHGFHQGKRQGAVLFRDACTPEDVNAISRSKMNVASFDSPLTLCKRQGHKNPECARPLDSSIICRARNYLSQAGSPGELQNIFVNKIYYELFGEGVTPAIRSNRVSAFLQTFKSVREAEACQTIFRKLKEIHDSLLVNPGNRLARRSQTTAGRHLNDEELKGLLNQILVLSPPAARNVQKHEVFIWIRKKKASLEELDIVPDFGNDPTLVVRRKSVEGLRTNLRKFNKGSNIKGNTNHSKTDYVGMNEVIQRHFDREMTVVLRYKNLPPTRGDFVKLALHFVPKPPTHYMYVHGGLA